jgi:hypothetical protein
MNRIRNTFCKLVPLTLFVLAACSSNSATVPTTPPPAPTGGWLTVQLTTPRSDDGAVQFSVTGPAIDSVKIVSYDGFATIDNGTANLIVTGQVGNGDIARVFVPDLSLTLQYQATVAAAAARGTYALQALDGYRAVLVR